MQLWWFNVQCSGITNWMFLLKCISKVKVKIGRNQWKQGTSLNCFVSEFSPFFVLWWGKCSYKPLRVVLIVKSLSHCASCCPLVLLKITFQYLLQRCCLCISLMCTFYYCFCVHLNFKQEEKLHNWGFYANGSLATCPLLTSLSKGLLGSNFGFALHLHLSHLDSLSPLYSSVVFKFPVFIFPLTCF